MAVTVIKAPAGLGKTSAAVKLLERARYGKIEIYVPTHKLAEETAQGLRALSIPPHLIVIRGREQPRTPHVRMCKRHDDAQALARKGYPIYPLLCSRRIDFHNTQRCEHYEDCSYLEQFRGPEQIYIYTHASLPLARSGMEEGIPGLAIIDEAFFQHCIETLTLPLASLMSTEHRPKSRDICRRVVEALLAGEPVLRTLRERGLGDSIRDAIAENPEDLPYFSPWWPERRQKRAIKALPERNNINTFLRVLGDELATPREQSHALCLDAKSSTLKVHFRKPITRFSEGDDKQSDVLVLDANADARLVAPWFPNFKFTSIAAGRKAFVLQCSSSRCSTTSLVPERNKDPESKTRAERRLKLVNELIEREAAGGARRILVVAPQALTGNAEKGVPALVDTPPNGALAHFNGVRGIDVWKDFDVVIVIGRNEPPIGEVEAIARAIWYDAPEPLAFAADWVVQERGYRVRGGLTPTGVEVLVHPDSRVQGVLEQLRECETAQAIDRLRLIHITNPKTVYLLSNIPVDVTVDELRTFEDLCRGSRLEQAWRRLHGVMPLAPAWLAETFPDLWKTAAAAKEDVGRAQKEDFLNSISIRNSRLLTCEYRVGGQTRRSHVLCGLPVPHAQDELTRLLGAPVVFREVVGGTPSQELFGAAGAAQFLAPSTQSSAA